MFSPRSIFSDHPLPQTMISAMYQYYQDPKNSLTIGELYLLLKMIVSALEDELEKTGMLDAVQMAPFVMQQPDKH